MTNLISGKEALIAFVNGESVEMADSEVGMDWTVISKHGFLDEKNISAPCLPMFFEESEHIQFRLKQTTIKLNIEIPAPFQPKDGERFFYINPNADAGYGESRTTKWSKYIQFGAWRTEEEIKQVVAALRGALKNG